MERVAIEQARLALPSPYLLFEGLPPNVPVNAKFHGWLTRQAELFAVDHGFRPAAFPVPQGGVGLGVTNLRIPEARVIYEAGTGGRQDEYAYSYVWTPFAPAVQGVLNPHGKTEANFQMPAANLAPNPDDVAVLRFRWRGATVTVALAVGGGDGTAGPFGPFDLTNAGAITMPIVPGTLVITAPLVAGGNAVLRDYPWPSANQARFNTEGILIGDADPGTPFGIINYETGQIAAVTFNGAIVNAVGNITASFESDYNKEPMDIRVEYDVNAI
jgi:hypothetical protein